MVYTCSDALNRITAFESQTSKPSTTFPGLNVDSTTRRGVRSGNGAFTTAPVTAEKLRLNGHLLFTGITQVTFLFFIVS